LFAKTIKHNYYRDMAIYNIVEAKTFLSRLIKDALAGKTVLIGKRSEPLVKLCIFKPNKRHLGLYDDHGWIAEDFNAPLEDFKDYE
jgi:antitoxin (DNA-binding transcriptional repressor) of toxin-antitoxin stability system